MASSIKPLVRTYKTSGTVKPFSFVKFDSSSADKNPTVVQAASGDQPIGISCNDADVTTGNEVEVAFPGGGAKLTLSGTVSLGNSIKVGASNGTGIAAASAGDHVGAFAVEKGVSGDVIGVHVVRGEKYNADAT